MNKGKKFLSELKLHSDYLKWIESENRYETWEDACESIIDGHRKKYKDVEGLEEYLQAALTSIKNKNVLASQRSLQYRFPQIKSNNERLYNCVGVLFNKNDYFQKAFHVLLSGCGLDFSLRKIFVEQLSKIQTRTKGTKTFVVPDSVEGWADSLGVLMSSYFVDNQPFPEYAGYEIKFDYSSVRPKGAYISGGFKAPGPDGLKQSLERIESLINNWIATKGNIITSILVYDIIMHSADAVLSGGVRRCLAKGSKVLTKEGTYKSIENIIPGDYVKTLNGYKRVTNTFIQGEQKTIKIIHQSGELVCTPNHKVAVIEGKEVIWKKAEELAINDKLIFSLKEEETNYINKLPKFDYVKPLHSTTCKNIVIPELDEEISYLVGLIQGDGYVRLTSKSGELSIAIEGDNPEKAYFVANILKRFNVNPGIQEPTIKDNSFKIRVKSKQLATYLHEHVKQAKTTLKIPAFILSASSEIKKAFVSGVFCADGSFKTRPPQVATSIYRPFLEELQVLLAELGVHSNIKYRVYPSRKETWQDIYSLNIRGKENFNKFKELLVLTPKANDKDYIINQGNTTILKPIKNIQPILIEEILEGNIVETFDIEVEDEHSFMCEGVLVHNSACSVLIDENDEEMIHAKLGNWRQKNPQRARSNNAIGLYRNTFSYDRLKDIIDLNQGDNDISFILVHDEYEVSNPCFSGDMKILTEEGYKTFEEIGENEVSLIDGSGNIKDAKVSISGVKKLIELKFRNRTSIKCTPQHVFLTTDEEEVEAQYLKGQRIAPYLNQTLDFNKEYIKYGFLQGDGCLGRLDSTIHKGLEINLNKKDIEISDLFEIENKQKVYINGYNEILNSLGFNSKPLPERELPLTIKEWEQKNLISFLRGLWSANGSIITNNRISFKSTCKNLIDQLSEILNSLGYNNYYTTNKPKVITFSNGDYTCKESYDLNIADYLSMEKFYNNIGFEQEYKNKALKQLLINKAPIVSSIKELPGIHKVYDFSIKDTILPWGIVEGVIAHNCREITFRPILEDGRTGFQMCVAPNTKLITKEGIEQIGQVAEEKREIEIWNGEKWSKVKPIKTGINNKLYRVYFNDGSYLDANYNHKFLVKNRFQDNFEEKTTGELINLLNTTKYALQVPRFKMEYEGGINEPKAYDYGFILGDGTCRSYEDGRLRKPFASIFESNFHLNFPFVSGNKSKILLRDNRGKQSKYYNVSFDVDYNFSERLKYEEGLPKEIFTWNKESIKNFLAGWIDSDGTVTYNNKVRVYGEESKIRDLQLLLTKIGTNSSVNLASKKGDVTNYAARKRDVWYVQISDCDGLWCTKTKLYKTEVSAKGKYQNIKNIEELENTSDVYCFEEFELHQGVFNNILTKQCNLTEINASACLTKEAFYKACVAASILGTVQAGYTNFPYLGKDTEDLVRREALIGVSITGWMNNPMLFDAEILKEGANVVKYTNKLISELIGINPAARTTTVEFCGL